MVLVMAELQMYVHWMIRTETGQIGIRVQVSSTVWSIPRTALALAISLRPHHSDIISRCDAVSSGAVGVETDAGQTDIVKSLQVLRM